MKDLLNKEYEKLKLITKDYVISVDQLDEYHEIQNRIKELRLLVGTNQ
jgi:hypothetical protein